MIIYVDGRRNIPSASNDQRLAATIVLDNVEAIERRAKVDTVQDHLCHKGVVDASALKDDSSVVEDCR